MKDKLRQHLDGIFKEAPDTQQNRDLKDEFYANLCDRYDEAIADGKSENDAYMISLRSLGDIHSLLGIKDETAKKEPDDSVRHINPAEAEKQRRYEEKRRRKELKRQRRYIKGPVFLLILLAYFIVSFATHAWYITWLLFIVNIFIDMVIDGIFEFREGGHDK